MDFLNGKKGIVITLLSLLIASFFVLTFSAEVELPLDSQMETIGFRITSLDRFVETWEEYAARSVRNAGYKTLAAMADWSDANNAFYSPANFQSMFRECLVNGTLLFYTRNCSGDGKKNNDTLTKWLDIMLDVALSNLTMNTSYEILGARVSQDFPFLATIHVNLSYSINDVYASIERNVTFREFVSIEGVRDPLAGRYLPPPASDRPVKETLIKDSEWNLANLTSFVNNREFRHRKKAPSLLMRFVGNFSSSNCCGIETVWSHSLDPIPSGGSLANSSYAGHYYFYDWESGPRFTCDEVFMIAGLPGVQLDQESLASYNISSSQWLTTC